MNPSVNTGNFARPTREEPVRSPVPCDVQESKVQGPKSKVNQSKVQGRRLAVGTATIHVDRVRDGDRQDACPTEYFVRSRGGWKG